MVAETLKVLLVAVTAASHLSPGSGGDGGAASLMRVLLPLLIQVSSASVAQSALYPLEGSYRRWWQCMSLPPSVEIFV